ncbi:unnamed protein product [Urochloa humidicola]
MAGGGRGRRRRSWISSVVGAHGAAAGSPAPEEVGLGAEAACGLEAPAGGSHGNTAGLRRQHELVSDGAVEGLERARKGVEVDQTRLTV